MSRQADPIFFVGMPRSGTTVMFESFACHPELGWFTNHLDKLPSFTPISALARLGSLSPMFRTAMQPTTGHRPWSERLRVGPSEGYRIWEALCGKKFVYSFLLDQTADPAERDRVRAYVARVLRYQGRRRFAGKLTGPARIEYLASIFERPNFVHVVRDGRAVVRSLLRVSFWKNTYRMLEPAWRGALSESDREEWHRHEKSPLVLAALQWRAVVLRAREERDRIRPAVYCEIRYEDFLADPIASVEHIDEVVGMSPSPAQREYLAGRMKVVRSDRPQRDGFEPEEWETLNALLGDLLSDLGYTV